jgi:hypothetical protein
MRALKIMVVVMAVLIVLGTTGLVTAIARRWSAPVAPVTQLPAWVSVALDEPVGTHIVGIAAVRDRLAVQLQGGGTDRVVLIDPATGAEAGRVSLSR